MTKKNKFNSKKHFHPTGHYAPFFDPLYKDVELFRSVVNSAVTLYQNKKIDLLVAMEGRGQILGSVMAYLLNLPFVPIRKFGKLPGEKWKVTGPSGTLEVHKDALPAGAKVLLVESIIGGEYALEGAFELLSLAQVEVLEVLALYAPQRPYAWEKSCPLQTLFRLHQEDVRILTEDSLELHFELQAPLTAEILSSSSASSSSKTSPMDARKRSAIIEELKRGIRTIPHFPKEGIMFRDITTLMLVPQLFHASLQLFKERYQDKDLQAILGIESRGFVFGAPLAYSLGLPFVPISKKGKIPGETYSVHYEIEYGTDEMELPRDALKKGDRVVVIDDLIATGGTADGACQLVAHLGGQVEEVACLIELPDLKARERLQSSLFTLIEFLGE